MSKNIYNQFKKQIGEFSVAAQFVELSKRCFTDNYKETINSPAELKSLAEQHNLTLACCDYKIISNIISLSHITNIHLCFESFLKDIDQQYQQYGDYPNKKQRKDKESLLEHITKALFNCDEFKSNEGLIELCEYYRLIRNSSVHNIYKDSSLRKSFINLASFNFKLDAKFGKLNAPNELCNIEFDDFVMFARASQVLAKNLYLSIKFDYKSIAKKYFDSYNVKYLCDEKKKKQLMNYIATNFRGNDDLTSIIDSIIF